MPHSVRCRACDGVVFLDDRVYATQVRGRRVRVVCKRCRAPINVDATGSEPKTTDVAPPACAPLVESGTAPPPPPETTPQCLAPGDACGEKVPSKR